MVFRRLSWRLLHQPELAVQFETRKAGELAWGKANSRGLLTTSRFETSAALIFSPKLLMVKASRFPAKRVSRFKVC